MLKGLIFKNNQLITSNGLDKIADNIKLALMTPVGTRPMLPNYGSRLYTLQYELLTPALFDLITIYIRESIANSVADIIVESVKLNANIKEKTIYISIAFRTANNEIGGTTMLYSDGKFTSS